MSVVRIPDKLHQQLKVEAAKSGLTLGALVAKKLKVANSTPLEESVKEYGNPDVNQVIQTFEKKLNLKLPRMGKQRIAASTLIKQYTLPIVLQAIDAVVAVQGTDYMPDILSLEDLRDKWNKLRAHFHRLEKEQSKNQIISV